MATIYDLAPMQLFEVPQEDTTTLCNMCHLPAIPFPERVDIDAGPLYQYAHPESENARLDECTVYCTHYFCILASPGISVEGKDHEGIKGILPREMMKEWRRGSRLKCTFCELKHATIGCSYSRCRNSYHFPCGFKNGCTFQFLGDYSSFCNVHAKSQLVYNNLTEDLLDKDRACGVCLEEIPHLRGESKEERAKNLHAPCCGGWLHRECIKSMARSAGYFFKCPFCNNNKSFLREMKTFGIFVPEQDASWELEGDHFEELEQRYSKCDAEVCLCPAGREDEEDFTEWEIVLCKTCGSQGIHVTCAGLTQNDELSWKCNTCAVVLEKLPTKTKYKFTHVNRRLTSKSYEIKCRNLLNSLKISVDGQSLKFLSEGRTSILDRGSFICHPSRLPVVLGVRLAPTSQGSETPSADSKSSSFGSLPKIPTAEPLKVLPINKLIHENRIFVPPLKQMLHDCLSNPPIKKLPPTSQKTRPFFKYGLTENIQDEILPSFDNKTLDIERKSQTQLKMCNPIKQKRPYHRKRKLSSDSPQINKFLKMSSDEKTENTSNFLSIENQTGNSNAPTLSVQSSQKLFQTSIFSFFSKEKSCNSFSTS